MARKCSFDRECFHHYNFQSPFILIVLISAVLAEVYAVLVDNSVCVWDCELEYGEEGDQEFKIKGL